MTSTLLYDSTKKKLLEEVFNVYTTSKKDPSPSGQTQLIMKHLILDDFTNKLVTNLFTQNELFDLGIISTFMLTPDEFNPEPRKPHRDIKAIYFIDGSRKSFEVIVRDFQTKTMYPFGCYIVSANTIVEPIYNLISQSVLCNKMDGIKDVHIGYYIIDKNVFITPIITTPSWRVDSKEVVASSTPMVNPFNLFSKNVSGFDDEELATREENNFVLTKELAFVLNTLFKNLSISPEIRYQNENNLMQIDGFIRYRRCKKFTKG